MDGSPPSSPSNLGNAQLGIGTLLNDVIFTNSFRIGWKRSFMDQIYTGKQSTIDGRGSSCDTLFAKPHGN